MTAALMLAAAFLSLLVAPALAQEPTPTPAATVTVVTRTSPVLTANQLLWFVLTTLAFALIALAIVFVYIYKIQARYYEITAGLARLGKVVKVTSAAPFIGPGGGLEAAGAAGILRITGPGVVTVGAESNEFTAALEDGTPATVATWTVTPANAATVRRVDPASGAQVTVIAAVAGAFTLRADVSEPTTASGEVQVAAVTAQSNTVELPFVGRGYGSIAIAIILIAAVIVLGLAGIFTGEGAATLLGGLLGYIFGATLSRPAGDAGGGTTPQA